MRERITVVSAEATTTTECVWAGQTLVAERVSETRAPGGRLQTTTTDYRYLYGPDSLPLELIVTPEGGTPVAYTFQCDGHGSVIALTDGTGAAVAAYAYARGAWCSRRPKTASARATRSATAARVVPLALYAVSHYTAYNSEVRQGAAPAS